MAGRNPRILSPERMHNLKLRIMFYLEDILRTSSYSQIALSDCSKELREESGYIGVFATKTR